MINIVTRSGSNAVHGSLFAFFRHQAMDATDPFAVNLEGATLRRVKPDADRQQFGATIGGPLVKDRTFHFLSYEQLRRREARTVPLLTDLSIFGATPEQEAILGRLPAAAAAQLRGALSTPAPVREMFRREQRYFPVRDGRPEGVVPSGPPVFERGFVDVPV